MCWNCEARVDYGVETCPSCGVYSSTSPLLEQSGDMLPDNSYITPPYRLVPDEEESEVPDSPYQIGGEEPVENANADSEEAKTVSIPFKLPHWESEMIPLGALLGGSVFSLFSLVLLLFSEEGVFTLQWNGNYWYLYTLVGLPLLYFGWKALESVEEDDMPESYQQTSSSEGSPH